MFNHFSNFYNKIKRSLFRDKYRKAYVNILTIFRRTTPLDYSDLDIIQKELIELHGESSLVRRKMRALKDAIEYKSMFKDTKVIENDVTYSVGEKVIKGEINSSEEDKYIKGIAPKIVKGYEDAKNTEIDQVERHTTKCTKRRCIECYKKQIKDEIQKEIELELRAKRNKRARRIRKSKIGRNLNIYNERLGLPRIVGIALNEDFDVEGLDTEEREAYDAWISKNRKKTANPFDKTVYEQVKEEETKESVKQMNFTNEIPKVFKIEDNVADISNTNKVNEEKTTQNEGEKTTQPFKNIFIEKNKTQPENTFIQNTKKELSDVKVDNIFRDYTKQTEEKINPFKRESTSIFNKKDNKIDNNMVEDNKNKDQGNNNMVEDINRITESNNNMIQSNDNLFGNAANPFVNKTNPFEGISNPFGDKQGNPFEIKNIPFDDKQQTNLFNSNGNFSNNNPFQLDSNKSAISNNPFDISTFQQPDNRQTANSFTNNPFSNLTDRKDDEPKRRRARRRQ